MSSVTPMRSLVLLALLSCLLVFALVPRYSLLDEGSKQSNIAFRPPHVARIDLPIALTSVAAGSTSAAPSSSQESSSSSSVQQQTTPSSTTSSTTQQQQQQTQQTSSSATSTTTSAPPSTTPSTPVNTPSQTSSAAQTTQQASNPVQSTPAQTSQFTSAVVTTDAQGQQETTIIIITASPASSTSASASPSSSAGASKEDSGVSSSTIIGLSVAGGVAVIGIVAFFVWKFTRKRFGDGLDDSEAIKWPDLNQHDAGVPLPTNQTGRAGFDTNSEVDLSRSNSRTGGYAGSIAATSTAELYPSGGPDPYAVPPLPHMNPNQPYLDDPNSRFYDPYRGPVPQTFNDTKGEGAYGGEAIPMTQMAGARARSPGPAQLYDVGGRASPQQSMATGRQSPGPQAAFGYGGARTASPAPAYSVGIPAPAAGRMSPGPQAAYGYGASR
ncbi:hypothetical protein EW146_g4744 [Bondarzewia mesenterica]|uniref:Mid2 domain-containing protein n=1 Tax=Bondarzewia mesenterica TaxID=1095465 RepID=A0A4S4LTL8_9AGAM|nr:hypothetical protein EW146_g4744 [Bondarzewia mesenterica]